MKAIEHLLEVLIFNSRWLLAPFYLGLVIGIVLLLVKFGQELIHAIPNIFAASESEVELPLNSYFSQNSRFVECIMMNCKACVD